MINYRFGNVSYFPFFPGNHFMFRNIFKFVQIASWMILFKKPGVGWMPYFQAHCFGWSAPRILLLALPHWKRNSPGFPILRQRSLSGNKPSRYCCCCPISRSSASGLWNRNMEWCFLMSHSGAEHRLPDRIEVHWPPLPERLFFVNQRSLKMTA